MMLSGGARACAGSDRPPIACTGRGVPVPATSSLPSDALERGGRVRDSWFEKLLELCLDDPMIGHFERQYELRDDDGRHVARFDLAVPDVKLGIEAHSREHHFGEEARRPATSTVTRRPPSSGWDVAYLGYSSLESPASVARRIARRVEVRRAQLGSGA
jgi:hypothetical protein